MRLKLRRARVLLAFVGLLWGMTLVSSGLIGLPGAPDSSPIYLLGAGTVLTLVCSLVILRAWRARVIEWGGPPADEEAAAQAALRAQLTGRAVARPREGAGRLSG